MMVIDNKFERGDVVYLKTDPQQLPRIVCKICIGESLSYGLTSGVTESWHYEFEIQSERDESLKLSFA